MNAHTLTLANVLTIQKLSKKFGERFAVNQASWSAQSGQIICLLGHSGCGKTTMLRLIAGLETPTEGSIQLERKVLWDPYQQVQAEERNIGFVFQDYALFPHLSVLENVMFGLKKIPKHERQSIAENALKHVSMSHHIHSYPHTLSGGEQQRVALARALAPKPHVLLMDEPFSNLDHRLRDQIRQSTIEILKQTSTTTIIVTHDPEEALQIADQIILMHQGKIIQSGTPKQLYFQPKTLFAARYFSDLNEIKTQIQDQQLHTIFGNIDIPKHLTSSNEIRCYFRPHQLRVNRIKTENSLAAKIISSNFLGYSQLLKLKIEAEDKVLSAYVEYSQHYDQTDTIYLSLDLSQCFFYESNDSIEIHQSST
ncbi:MAG: Fe3+/spermidine/putrescine ABC transporter ATP-binding protein [Acinetobacter sp. GWC1_38_13]|uniref:ABC transporter ATP-binding protein n=1 Tax=Acinetobacter junii TaxID=40215 RepID=A0A365PG80_ACIJU|nr:MULTISPECIES: ABC transporter ATP-binding protein [Acinetobacter]OFW47435.1 MAG: Fe3+/spermidine/putrescine ABC transporter ATP-binding protein [Acinetobacter sp. GWC1_38_13]RBA33396.1 ABC transporter ATP-binding protein [Acinetobacter junii]RBA41362.1 ABC transporter ATP-binding protein [Acinetobacter junii]RBA44452.1 ABC transporter ATP-binding protein [Acinetobacter junii]WLF73609.1 ABC transporter ATP-binding protein [Acinetobacter junii]